MIPVLLGLGSNVEPRERFLRQAVHRLGKVGEVRKVAPLYETEPYGEKNQPAFLNSALLLLTGMSPGALLQALKAIEKEVGRVERYRWGPREIDLDILFYGQEQLATPELTIPHPEYARRRFVLQPLADIAPEFVAPDSGRSIRELLRRCHDHSRVVRLKKQWIRDGSKF